MIKFDDESNASIKKLDNSSIPHVETSGFDDTFFEEKSLSFIWTISEKDTYLILENFKLELNNILPMI